MNKKVDVYKGFIFVFTMFCLCAFYGMFYYSNNMSQDSLSFLKVFLSWCGIIELIYIFISWYRFKKSIFSLYLLFMLFFFVFNYGQCFIWAIGMHAENEIGSISLFYRLGVPSTLEIVKTQLIVLISGLMIHLGAVISSKNKSSKILPESEEYETKNITNEKNKKNLFHVSMFLYPFVVFSEFYFQINNIINSRKFGYTGLYYNANVQNVNVIFQIAARLFFPVMIGMLLSSNFNSKVRKIAYSTFAIDVVLSILVGDRGGWIYALIILIICHYKYYKKPNFRQLFTVGFVGYFFMVILITIKRIRNAGVTLAGFLGTFSNAFASPFTETLTEMGGTMGITTALVMKGWNIFPYGNTFLYGTLIAPSKRLISILNLNYESLSSWFSQSYLRISNGAAFSIVGEVLINYGPFLLPFIMIIFGVIVNFITNIDDYDYNLNVVGIFFKIITTSVFINISRNCYSYNLGEILYTTVLFYVLYSCYSMLRNNKKLL